MNDREDGRESQKPHPIPSSLNPIPPGAARRRPQAKQIHETLTPALPVVAGEDAAKDLSVWRTLGLTASTLTAVIGLTPQAGTAAPSEIAQIQPVNLAHAPWVSAGQQGAISWTPPAELHLRTAEQLAEEIIAAYPDAPPDQQTSAKVEILGILAVLRALGAFLIDEAVKEAVKDVAKEVGKRTIGDWVAKPLAQALAQRFRRAGRNTNNSILTRVGDLLQKVSDHLGSQPGRPVSADQLAEDADATPSQVEAALKIAGFRKRGALWVPLSVVEPPIIIGQLPSLGARPDES